ncbi:MAG TPA: nucleoside triphosphate pyrophosphohydrolase [Abditibacteriaceae bacterium]|jgi:tetrapyrrole methylase family protein/MazG family protein
MNPTNSESTSKPTPAQAFERLAQIIARLRAPDGCPWDREQTHITLRTHLLEEACETMDAIDGGDDAHLCEELGDLLMQPVLHAQIAEEESRFDIVDVIEGISDKLVRRHPHVFGEVIVADSGEVLTNWEAIKKAEKEQKGQSEASILSGVPNTLPSLMQALEVSKKAVKVGFEWPDMAGVMAKLHEEIAELEEEIALSNSKDEAARQRITEELGDVLFTVVNIARWHKINPELALRDTVTRFRGRFEKMEESAHKLDLQLQELTPQQWDELWEAAKKS